MNIFVIGKDLRETVWHNVLTLPRIQKLLPGWMPDFEHDQPTWVKPIKANESIKWNDIGLVRGLFWQPTRLELVQEKTPYSCDLLEGNPVQVYAVLLKEQFKFSVDRLWPHPHGARTATISDGVPKWKFAAFSATTPAWTQLSEFVVPRGVNDPNAKEGSEPSGPVAQADELSEGRLHLWVGGYCAKQGSIVGRRHEMISLAQGWRDDQERVPKLVEIGKDAKKVLYGKLLMASKGYENKKKRIKLKGIGAAIHETGEKLFYTRTEALIHETFSNKDTFKEWKIRKAVFAEKLATHCGAIFEELTDPYAMKPELIPVIAWARRSLNSDLAKLTEGP